MPRANTASTMMRRLHLAVGIGDLAGLDGVEGIAAVGIGADSGQIP